MNGPTSLSDEYLGASQDYEALAITGDVDVNARYLLTLTAGDVVVVTPKGGTVTFPAAPAYTYIMGAVETIKAATTAQIGVFR